MQWKSGALKTGSLCFAFQNQQDLKTRTKCATAYFQWRQCLHTRHSTDVCENFMGALITIIVAMMMTHLWLVNDWLLAVVDTLIGRWQGGLAKIDKATIKLIPGVHVFNQKDAILINLETHDTRQICVVFLQRRQKKRVRSATNMCFFPSEKVFRSACCFVCHHLALAKVGKGGEATFRLKNWGGKCISWKCIS